MNRTSRIVKTLSLAALLASLAAAPAFAAEAGQAFAPPKEKILEPYTNNKCLKDCHAEKNLKAGGLHGEKRDLFVDNDGYFESTHGQKGLWCIDCHQGADPNFHPRAGYPKVDCRACHSEKPPEGVFPKDAASILAARNLKKPDRKALKGDGWTNSEHGRAHDEGKVGAPSCAGCHTAHYVRKSKDPASTVNRANLSATCGKCHEAQVRNYDVGGFIARWSIAGHGKGDFSQLYSESQCLSCHQGHAAHGEETLTGQACPNCHRPSEKIGAGQKGFHVKVDEGCGYWTRIFYDLLFWGGAAGLLFIGLFFGITTLYRKDDSGGDA